MALAQELRAHALQVIAEAAGGLRWAAGARTQRMRTASTPTFWVKSAVVPTMSAPECGEIVAEDLLERVVAHGLAKIPCVAHVVRAWM